MFEIRELQLDDGTAPYSDWYDALPLETGLRVEVALRRMRAGNLGDVKRLGGGVFERRLHFGPGYRIYFGRKGDRIIILLTGGTKRSQQRDIRAAQRLWKHYEQTERSIERWF